MKQKTVKSAKKRVIITGSGKVMRRKMSAQHLTVGKSKRTKRLSGRKIAIAKADSKKIKGLIPNR